MTIKQPLWWILPGMALLIAFGTPASVGSWNDGSRLAAVESLVERGTWTIDDSIFVQPPKPGSGLPSPYVEGDPNATRGTLDKLWIGGHYYSDKSPVPTVLLAGFYAVLRNLEFPRAEDNPTRFCWVLSVVPMGLSFLLAVGCIWGLGLPLGLPDGLRMLLTVSFAFATMAGAYSLSLNNHMMLLGVSCWIWLELAWLTRGAEHATSGRLLRLGVLSGFAYSIDLGAGPPIAAFTLFVVLWRIRSTRLIATFVLAALPCFLLHHGIGYWLGGTLKPMNAVPEYLNWPGSPHNLANMSGVWAHEGPVDLGLYALDLLWGKKGFLLHNLPLLVLIPGLIPLIGCRHERGEVLAAVLMCLGVWAMYSVGSSNRGGACLSIRWFLPLLAPGFFLLALALREWPALRRDLTFLTLGGSVLVGLMIVAGPWTLRMVPGYWGVVLLTAAVWVGYRIRHPFLAGSTADIRSPAEDNPLPDKVGCPAAA